MLVLIIVVEVVHSYAPGCFPNKATHMNVNVFNLISRVNETRLLVQHQSCEGKYRSNNNVSNSKYIWNQDECRFEGKELDDWVYIDCLHVES